MKTIIIPALALALSGCAATNSFDKITIATTAAIELDAKFRDKCAYLVSGVAIARLAVGLIPVAATYVDRGESLIDAYCSGRPITDFASAMATMERLIVAIRPVAARVQ